MFSSLNKIFPGSDLLQIYRLYTTNKLHHNRSDIHAIYEKLSVTSLPSSGDFHSVMRQYHTVEAANNILANKLPTDANPQSCRSLLQNLTCNSNTFPLEICTDFILALKELELFAALPDGSAMATASLTFALSTVYPATYGATIQPTALLARLAASMLSVDPD